MIDRPRPPHRSSSRPLHRRRCCRESGRLSARASASRCQDAPSSSTLVEPAVRGAQVEVIGCPRDRRQSCGHLRRPGQLEPTPWRPDSHSSPPAEAAPEAGGKQAESRSREAKRRFIGTARPHLRKNCWCVQERTVGARVKGIGRGDNPTKGPVRSCASRRMTGGFDMRCRQQRKGLTGVPVSPLLRNNALLLRRRQPPSCDGHGGRRGQCGLAAAHFPRSPGSCPARRCRSWRRTEPGSLLLLAASLPVLTWTREASMPFSLTR